MIRILKILTISILLSSCTTMTTRTIDYSITLDKNTTFCIANVEDKVGTIRNLKQNIRPTTHTSHYFGI